MVRFLRQRNRIIGALGTPVVFWLLLGSGLNRTFAVEMAQIGGEVGEVVGSTVSNATGLGYLEYFFPGTVVMILLFTAIFSTFSVIEDRREGFLQGVLVSPAPRLAIVLGKVLGGASLATGQAALFILLWPLIGPMPSLTSLLLLLPVMFLLSMGLTALGLCLAWPMESTAGFHAIMNLLLLPMWFLSGAVFPVQTAAPWLSVVMYANPLTYGHTVLAWLMLGERGSATWAIGGTQGPMWAALIALIGVVVINAAAVRIVAKPGKA